MSSQKRFSDGLHNSSSSKFRRVEAKQTIPVTTAVLNNIAMSSVEVMEVPDKSEYDKKSYRVIRLQNGLKALLISDPTQKLDEKTEEDHQEAATTSDDEAESESDNSGDESDDESGDRKRGKLAACSLCVDVGSFSDPRDVQGLAHFLGRYSFESKFVL